MTGLDPFHEMGSDLVPGLVPNAPARGLGNWQSPPDDRSYDLCFVEFDDQGQPFEPDAIHRVLEFVEACPTDPLVIVFVHGWKHSARDGDENVESFRRLLHAMAHIELLRPKDGAVRLVIGVYVGWRGLTLHWLQLLQNATFYGRSEGALRVALGSARELFARLRLVRLRRTSGAEGPSGPRLVIAGHSFGGLIVFSALAEYLIESAAAPAVPGTPLKGFGDLVILANPAFEAARYLPLHAIATRRRFEPRQPPVFVSVTSSTDNATKIAFPLGRQFWPYRGASRGNRERDAKFNTMGHLPWMQTHKLSRTAASPTAAAAPVSRPYSADKRLDNRERNDRLDREDADFRAFRSAWENPDGSLKPGWTRTYSEGAALTHLVDAESASPWTPDNPFWVVQAGSDIIDGHNDIFGTTFLDFLRQVFDDTIRAASPSGAR